MWLGLNPCGFYSGGFRNLERGVTAEGSEQKCEVLICHFSVACMGCRSTFVLCTALPATALWFLCNL